MNNLKTKLKNNKFPAFSTEKKRIRKALKPKAFMVKKINSYQQLNNNNKILIN